MSDNHLPIKIIFFGSPQNSADLLAVLDRDPRFKILAAVTQPDRKTGRKQTLTPTPVAQYAQSRNIPTLKPERNQKKKHLLKNPKRLKNQLCKSFSILKDCRQNASEGNNFSQESVVRASPLKKSRLRGKSRLSLQLSDEEDKRAIRRRGGGELISEEKFVPKEVFTDLILSYNFGQLIPKEILSLARLGGINIHFSLLPAYRGAAPIPWQIINNEKNTGISIVKMSPKFDKGDIIYQKKCPIYPNDTQISLNSRLSNIVLKILPDILADYASGNLPDHSDFPNKPSYYPRLTRQDGFIPWRDFLLACRLSQLSTATELVVRAGKPNTFSPKAPPSALTDGGIGTVFLGHGASRPGTQKKWTPHAGSCQKAEKSSQLLAAEIERKVRALSPWPGVWTVISGKRLPAGEAGKVENGKFNNWIKKYMDKKIYGKRLKILDAKLKSGRLIPTKIQLEGENPHLVNSTTT